METEKLVNIIEDEFGLPFTKYELSVTGKKLVEKVEAETSQFQVLCKPSLWCRIEIH